MLLISENVFSTNGQLAQFMNMLRLHCNGPHNFFNHLWLSALWFTNHFGIQHPLLTVIHPIDTQFRFWLVFFRIVALCLNYHALPFKCIFFVFSGKYAIFSIDDCWLVEFLRSNEQHNIFQSWFAMKSLFRVFVGFWFINIAIGTNNWICKVSQQKNIQILIQGFRKYLG